MQYIFYHGLVTDAGARNVEAIVTAAVAQGEEELVLCIASLGGDVNAGIGLYNFLQMVPITVHTHAAGLCYSIAATLSLAGMRRTASPMSLFSIHAARFSEGPSIGEISPETDLISQPFRTRLGWSDDEIAARFRADDFYFGPEEAYGFGMVGAIEDLRIEGSDRIIPVNIP